MDDENKSSNGWNEWSRHVLKELERLNDTYESIRGDVSQIKQDAAAVDIREIKKDIEKFKTFKTQAVTVWMIVQAAAMFFTIYLNWHRS